MVCSPRPVFGSASPLWVEFYDSAPEDVQNLAAEVVRLRAEIAAERDLLAMATEFTIGDRDNELDPFSFVSVQWRRDDLWVARVGDMKTRALTADLECEWEATPGNRTDEFRDVCYCPLAEAMDRARRWLARRAEKAVSHG